jgi:4-oxalocrotonate tautomerase
MGGKWDMPIVHVNWIEGRSVEQKRELVEKITKAVVEAGKCAPEAVSVIIHDLPRTDIGKAGVLFSDKK